MVMRQHQPQPLPQLVAALAVVTAQIKTAVAAMKVVGGWWDMGRIATSTRHVAR